MSMTEERDELLGEAAELIIREGKASTSFVQRRLQIGYNRAARIIEQLEARGIVTAPDAVGKRIVTDKGNKSLEISKKIMDISGASGVPAQKVLDKAMKAVGVEQESDNTLQHVGGVAGQRLKSFIERVERLEEEKAALMEDIKEVFAEAKGVGFDTKTMRRLIKLRKMDAQKRTEDQELLSLYADAIGMQGVLF